VFTRHRLAENPGEFPTTRLGRARRRWRLTNQARGSRTTRRNFARSWMEVPHSLRTLRR
jgi:hypothetical protein